MACSQVAWLTAFFLLVGSSAFGQAPGANEAAKAPAPAYPVGARVQVKDGGSWWHAEVKERKGDKCFVHYVFKTPPMEWVSLDRLREDPDFGAVVGTSFYVGTWATQQHVVFNIVKEKRLNSKLVLQTIQRQGGNVGGYLHIKADKTYIRVNEAGVKSVGKWAANQVNAWGGIVLFKGDKQRGDLFMTPQEKGTLVYVRDSGGGAGWRGWMVKDTSLLDLDEQTNEKFFQARWELYRPRHSPLLQSDYGTLHIDNQGTFTHVLAGKTTTGKWDLAKDFFGIVLHDFMGQRDFRVIRLPNDNRFLHLAGVQDPSLALYGMPASP